MPGNVGFNDMMLAISWTHLFVRYFGGDPDKITVFGVSAGAEAASLLSISPKSNRTLPFTIFFTRFL